MRDLGVDLIDCSSGGLVPSANRARPGYQVPFARSHPPGSRHPDRGGRAYHHAAGADQIVRCGQADLVLLAREFLRDPYFPLHAARALVPEPDWPVQYGYAVRRRV